MYRIDYYVSDVRHTYARHYKSFRKAMNQYIEIFRINNSAILVDEDGNIQYQLIKL